MEMTTEYAIALAEVRNATRIYNAAVKDYRSRITNDDEFLAAKAAYAEAQAKFDAAFAVESNLGVN